MDIKIVEVVILKKVYRKLIYGQHRYDVEDIEKDKENDAYLKTYGDKAIKYVFSHYVSRVTSIVDGIACTVSTTRSPSMVYDLKGYEFDCIAKYTETDLRKKLMEHIEQRLFEKFGEGDD